jgi:hypothetical protein
MRLEGCHGLCKLPSFETRAKCALLGDEGPSVWILEPITRRRAVHKVRAYSFTAPVIADT